MSDYERFLARMPAEQRERWTRGVQRRKARQQAALLRELLQRLAEKVAEVQKTRDALQALRARLRRPPP